MNHREIDGSDILMNFLVLNMSLLAIIIPDIRVIGIEIFMISGIMNKFNGFINHDIMDPIMIEIGLIIIMERIIRKSEWIIISGLDLRMNLVESKFIRIE